MWRQSGWHLLGNATGTHEDYAVGMYRGIMAVPYLTMGLPLMGAIKLIFMRLLQGQCGSYVFGTHVGNMDDISRAMWLIFIG